MLLWWSEVYPPCTRGSEASRENGSPGVGDAVCAGASAVPGKGDPSLTISSVDSTEQVVFVVVLWVCVDRDSLGSGHVKVLQKTHYSNPVGSGPFIQCELSLGHCFT